MNSASPEDPWVLDASFVSFLLVDWVGHDVVMSCNITTNVVRVLVRHSEVAKREDSSSQLRDGERENKLN